MQRSLLGFCGRSSQDRGTQQHCGQTKASDLVSLNFSRCPLAPSMYKDKDGTLLIVHVDDVQGVGNETRLRNSVASLKKKYVVSLEGPFLLGADYARGYSLDAIKFLKRKFSYFNHRLSICIDPKYIQKLEELFSLSHRKPKAAPCGNDILKVDPNPVHLGAEDHRKYRTWHLVVHLRRSA